MRAERQAIIKMLDSDVSNKQKLHFIESFVKDLGITNSVFEYKCINCNTYFGRRSLNEQ